MAAESGGANPFSTDPTEIDRHFASFCAARFCAGDRFTQRNLVEFLS
jgi:hypothetical protein